ncbi:MAG: putative zinc ribbon domain protein [Candidatus Hydrogenedentes bacterium ADurb.Bin101]|nr:MAG: putative zinc ribbon domain protein [Candidatus Hydrogenedentes bacterium ADurb.Bin101]HOC69361.1 C4-type zinc ribbon domain-containing protein [Candidatus Hydrogenedentota bacterium]
MQALLELQELDRKIAVCKAEEKELPKQKDKYAIHRKRLTAELKESEDKCKQIQQKQRECAGDIEQRQEQLKKYDTQLYSIRKNEEYKALLHEMELMKKQIAIKEERIIALMLEYDEAKAALQADKERIEGEVKKIEQECKVIDDKLHVLISERKELEKSRGPMAAKVPHDLLSRYERVRKVRTPAVVPLNDETCGGCFMAVRPQIVNEILANDKIHACQHCGRLLYHVTNLETSSAGAPGENIPS